MKTKILSPSRKPKIGPTTFDPAVSPKIACFNKSTVPMSEWDVDLDTLVEAMQEYVDEHIVPVWGTPATLHTTEDFEPGEWAMVFLDDSDQADFLAYHELTPDGLPISKVFVKTILGADPKELVSVSASHELVEMLVDPAINLYTSGPKAKIAYNYVYEGGDPVRRLTLRYDIEAMYAYESADPVEATFFNVKNVPMSNFVFPTYFEGFRQPGSVQFDHENKIKRPFQLLPGGYQSIFINGEFTNVFGSKAKEKLFAKEDRRDHRSEMRKLSKLRRSGR